MALYQDVNEKELEKKKLNQILSQLLKSKFRNLQVKESANLERLLYTQSIHTNSCNNIEQ